MIAAPSFLRHIHLHYAAWLISITAVPLQLQAFPVYQGTFSVPFGFRYDPPEGAENALISRVGYPFPLHSSVFSVAVLENPPEDWDDEEAVLQDIEDAPGQEENDGSAEPDYGEFPPPDDDESIEQDGYERHLPSDADMVPDIRYPDGEPSPGYEEGEVPDDWVEQ